MPKKIRRHAVIHVLKDAVHSVDQAVLECPKYGIEPTSIARVYAFDVCDFTPGTHGIGHELYHDAFVEHSLKPQVSRGEYIFKKMEAEEKKMFVSLFEFGSKEWIVDARNWVGDRALNVRYLIPPKEHICLQVLRSNLVANNYGSRAENSDISPSAIGSFGNQDGYTIGVTVLFQKEEEVKRLINQINSVVLFCGFKSNCSSLRCSCKKQERSCIGCRCAMGRLPQ